MCSPLFMVFIFRVGTCKIFLVLRTNERIFFTSLRVLFNYFCKF